MEKGTSFQMVSLDSGRYVLVPEENYKELMQPDHEIRRLFEIPDLNLADFIKHHRVAKNLSQKQVADHLNISKKLYQRYENKNDKHHIKKIEKKEILYAFIELFGEKFKNGLIALGYVIER